MAIGACVSVRVLPLHSLAGALLGAALLALAPGAALAGGPKYVAGSSYFNAGVAGQPVHWANGQVGYYVDQGALSDSVSNQQATAMVDAAAALWSAVPTAGVTLVDKGPLNEDVSGANIAANALGTITAPADVTPAAASYPVAVIYDADGAVIDAVLGAGASEPTSCQNNGVLVWMDKLNPDATFAHGVIVLNGLCTTSGPLLNMMSFEVERAFGRVLGLDAAQVNPGALTNGESGGTEGWPVMQPVSGLCGPLGGVCLPDQTVLRADDIAALNRIYPITAANLASFPGKRITADNTISIRGTIHFRSGYGMQGVNVVARPLDASGNPLYPYTVTAVSGAVFCGNHGNPVTGWKDANGNARTMWGSEDGAQQGAFDLSGIPLPPGMTTASYQISFEAIDPLYILSNPVGPYVDGQVEPSGTLSATTLRDLAAGSTRTLDMTVTDSAAGGSDDALGAEAQPRPLPATGMWGGRLSQVGQSDWLSFPVRGNRVFTVVTQALDETGTPTNAKAMPAIGIWDAFDAIGSTAVGAAPGLNGLATGETWVRVTTSGDDLVRVGVADVRGDGRPDYAYEGWVLYLDAVEPQRLPAAGGPIVLRGMGFRLGDTVLVGGQAATVTSLSPTEITAIAPAAAGATGSVDVEVDDQPAFYAAAILPGGLSYDAGSGDALTLITAPSNTIPIGVPASFTVAALGPTLTPAGGVTVRYTLVSGTAKLGCGAATCTVITDGSGQATMNVTAADNTWSIVTAALTNGSSLQAEFMGGTPPAIAALTPQLSLAAGAAFSWTTQVLALNNGTPASGQSVTWQAVGSGITVPGTGTTTTNAAGIAAKTLTVGPLTAGQTATVKACLNGASPCVTLTAYGARPEYAQLQAVSGTSQSLAVTGTPSQIVLRLLDMNGNPMAGGTVTLYQALYAWTPPCSPHVVCAPGALLATQAGTATSAVDGTAMFVPASLPGVQTQLVGLAASGNTATVGVAIEER